MRNHNDLLNMNERSLEQQAAVRRATCSRLCIGVRIGAGTPARARGLGQFVHVDEVFIGFDDRFQNLRWHP